MKTLLSLLQSENEEEAGINLTPLIDVVFVILIMFILVAPLVEIDKVELAHSATNRKEKTSLSSQDQAIQIYVHKDNTIWLDGVSVSIDELKGKLLTLYRLHPSLSPQIFQDREAFFGTYQLVKNLLEEVGFESLDVVLQPG